jgi:hypothetical protein
VSRSAQMRETSLLEIPEIRTEGFHQLVDLARGRAIQIGLNHRREQALIDPAPPLQQRREERATAQRGDAQL